MPRWTGQFVLGFALLSLVGQVTAETLADLKTSAIAKAVAEYLKSAPKEGPVMKSLADLDALVEVQKVQAAEGLTYSYDTNKKAGQFAWEYTAKKPLDDSEKQKIGKAITTLLAAALTERKGDLKLDDNSFKDAIALVGTTNLTAKMPAVVAQPQPTIEELKQLLDEQKKQLAKNIEDQKNEVKKLRDENSTQKTEMDKLGDELKKANKSIDDQKKLVKTADEQKAAAMKTIDEQKLTIDKANGDLTKTNKLFEEARALVKATEKAGAELKADLSKSQIELKNVAKDLEENKKLLKTVEGQKDAALEMVKVQKSEIQKVVDELKKVADDLKKLNKLFDDQKTMLKKAEDDKKALAKVIDDQKTAYNRLIDQAAETVWWLELETDKLKKAEKKLALSNDGEGKLREQLRDTEERLLTAQAEQGRLQMTVSALTPRMTLYAATLFPSTSLPTSIPCASIPSILTGTQPSPFLCPPTRMRVEYVEKCVGGQKVCVPTLVPHGQ